METMFEVFKWKLSSVASAAFIRKPQDATFLEMECREEGGGEWGSFWTFEVTIDTVAMAAASTALVTLPHHETVTMKITSLRFPHQVDITGWASPWLINGFWGCLLSSAGRKQIYFIFSVPPPHPHHPPPTTPPGFVCAHTCVKLKLSWPYIWLRMLFLWLKHFICWNISGDTLSRFGGGGGAGTMATRCCHMYRRRCQLTETTTEQTQIGVCMRVGASAQTCLWVSIFIRRVGRNPIMALSVRINDGDLSRLWLERRQRGENSTGQRV